MANKTFIPAFKAGVGDWDYFICIMKYAEVARQVNFAYELGGNAELNQMIQRGISKRTEEIKQYLLNSEHRFLGALIVAAWGGAPKYMSVSMEDPDGVLSGIDKEFGVLTFDGTQQYFALDGQHRLRAIKEVLKKKPELGNEDICVIMVSHFDTEEGKIRTRRLFTNINRNAKPMTGAENIVLDEDDGPAILTRRLLVEHPLLSPDGVVKVFTAQGQEGELRLAGASVAKTDARALSTIATVYEVVKYLVFDQDASMRKRDARPSDDVLESSYEVVSERITDLLKAASLDKKISGSYSARELRAPKNAEGSGNAFMRPVVQKAVARMSAHIAQQGGLSWSEVMERLSDLDWKISGAPWTAVYNPQTNKMIGAKENVELLDQLLYCHIAPPSKQFVTKARKLYKQMKSEAYPVPEDSLVLLLAPQDDVHMPDVEDALPAEGLSEAQE